jgi:hypothetical protein
LFKPFRESQEGTPGGMGMNQHRKKIDTDKCYFCPKRIDIEVHHIVPQRFNGTDKQENLVALCDRCHKKLERLYDKRFYQRLGIKDTKGVRKNHFECLTCDSRADVKVAKVGMEPDWYCYECAVDFVERVTVDSNRLDKNPEKIIRVLDSTTDSTQSTQEQIIQEVQR